MKPSYALFLIPLLILVLLVLLPALGHWQMDSIAKRSQKSMSAPPPEPAQVFTKEHIAHLPPPVQKWISRSGAIGKPITHSVYLTQKGRMRTTPEGSWMPFEAKQWFTIPEASFLWRARVEMAPFLWIEGLDRYVEGKGHMLIRAFSIIPVADAKGPETDQGSMLRYLAETIWFPSSAVSKPIRWEAVDSKTARATLTTDGRSVTGTFHFDEEGNVQSFSAMRYYDRKTGPTLEPWRIEVLPGGTRTVSERNIAADSRVIWELEEGDFHWLDVHIESIEYR